MARDTTVPHQHSSLAADRVRLFIPADQFSDPYVDTQAAGTRLYDGTQRQAYLQSVNSSLPVRRFDVVTGLGAYCSTQFTVPDDMHVGSACNVVVVWGSDNTTTTNTATWAVTYTSLAASTAVGDPTTALNTTITSSAITAGAWSRITTAEGIVNAASWTNGDLLLLKVQLSAVSGLTVPLSGANADNVVLYGVELRYVRRFL